ncbi:unnamed protein product [Schistosoma margrebowiei]|uniref:Uncharacterized protein n=1 Tax=Schistosoma margrebowiei TaxID=48269 RepID=A0A183N6Y7_9TREM|nr:unnamed protein product [Schistosoma margrebowiei]
MVVGGSPRETLNPGFVLLGTRQQGVSVILKELVLPDGFEPESLSFTVRDIISELSGPQPTSHAVSSHLDWWPHCNMVDNIRSALIRT